MLGSVIAVAEHLLNVFLSKNKRLLYDAFAGKRNFDDFIIKIGVFKFVANIIEVYAYHIIQNVF